MKAATAVCALVLVIAGCGPDDARTPLVVYSAHGRDILFHFEKAFEKAHPKIDVVTVYAGSHDLLLRIRAERSNPQAAVWWGADSTSLDAAANEGLLEAYVPSYDAPDLPRHPKHLWTACFSLPIVLGYHPSRISAKDLPRTFAELGDERFRGLVVLREPFHSGTLRTFIGALIARSLEQTGNDEQGFQELARIHRNVRTYSPSPEFMFRELEHGPASITVWNLTDLVFQKQSAGFTFLPAGLKEPVPVLTDGVALIAGAAANPDAAAFYEFVNSLDALEYLAREHARIPVRPDFDRDRLTEPLRNVGYEPMTLDWRLVGERLPEWMRRFEEQIHGRASRR